MTMIGVMQGRLVPPEGGRLQSFPRDRWKDEFARAAEVPLLYLEWIHDAYGADVNPLFCEAGLKKVAELSADLAVYIRAVCADWFMDFPFFRCSASQYKDRLNALHRLLKMAPSVQARRLVLPFVDQSRISSSVDKDTVVRTIEHVLPSLEACGIELHLETDLPPDIFASLLDRVTHPMVKVNYDSGNSASLGFNVGEEFAAYGHRVGSVHIKDRLRGGETVSLGTGDTDFEQLFANLKSIAYIGDFTLQAARGEPGDEVQLARTNVAFIKSFWEC